MKRTLDEDIERAISFHGHLCGGQLTGVRMARFALQYFGIEDPDIYRDLLVYVECDRCLTDAIMVVTNCHPGKRRMKCLDFGKQAATFYDIQSDRAIRMTNISEKAPKDTDVRAWFAAKSDEELFKIEEVRLALSEYDLPGRPRKVATCNRCGEQVTDGREVQQDGEVLCRNCAQGSYYEIVGRVHALRDQ